MYTNLSFELWAKAPWPETARVTLPNHDVGSSPPRLYLLFSTSCTMHYCGPDNTFLLISGSIPSVVMEPPYESLAIDCCLTFSCVVHWQLCASDTPPCPVSRPPPQPQVPLRAVHRVFVPGAFLFHLFPEPGW